METELRNAGAAGLQLFQNSFQVSSGAARDGGRLIYTTLLSLLDIEAARKLC